MANETMIDAARRRAFRESIERLLAERTRSGNVLTSAVASNGPATTLGLYVGRFAGFAALPDMDARGLLDHALFDAVDVGTERLHDELRAMDAATPQW